MPTWREPTFAAALAVLCGGQPATAIAGSVKCLGPGGSINYANIGAVRVVANGSVTVLQFWERYNPYDHLGSNDLEDTPDNPKLGNPDHVVIGGSSVFCALDKVEVLPSPSPKTADTPAK
jgi:hypothetical protein